MTSPRAAAARLWAAASRHRRLLQYLFGGAVLAFIGLYLYRHARELAGYPLSLAPGSLALAFGGAVALGLWTALLWGLGLRVFQGVRLGWRDTLVVWHVSQLAKYLPGNVWNYVGRVYLCARKGIPAEQAAASLVLEMVLTLLAQAIGVLLSLPFWARETAAAVPAAAWWALAVVPVGLLLLQPRVFNWLFGRLARRRRVGPAAEVALGPRRVLPVLGLYAAGVGLAGAGFYFFCSGLFPLPPRLLPALTGMLSLALIAGFVTPFAPNGLGVREGLLALALGQAMPGPAAALVALASRLWLTAAELAALLISVAISRVGGDNPKGLFAISLSGGRPGRGPGGEGEAG